MMSFALMGCLIFSASDAMAQGRSRSQGGSSASRSQSAAVSRSHNSGAPTVSSNAGSSMSRRSEATPQVNRSTSSSSRSTTTPQVNRSTTSSSRSTTTPQVTRSNSGNTRSGGAGNHVGGSTTRSGDAGSHVGGSTTRGNGDKGTVTVPSTTRRSDSSAGKVDKVTKSDRTSTVGNRTTDARPSVTPPAGNIKPGNNDKGGNGKPGGIDKGGSRKPDNGRGDNGRGGNGRHGGNDKPGGIDKGGNGKPGGIDKGGHDKDRHGDRGRNVNGYNPKNRYDYSGHHYRDEFSRHHTNHSWSWHRPLPPPVRYYRPVLREWYRPVVPYGWHYYTGAPVIDRILGISFGSLFNTSIDYLYYNGYEIDGFADHVIYLRDVALINFLWEDVMLCFDNADMLVNAQFIYHNYYNDTYRYDRIYNSLCRVYGPPITGDSRGVSWFGGSGNGWVTLSTYQNLGHYYMTLSIGY